MSKEELVLVAGAGGFIGGHLVSALRAEGFENIRAVDQKPLANWYQTFDDVENLTLDLKELEACRVICAMMKEIEIRRKRRSAAVRLVLVG